MNPADFRIHKNVQVFQCKLVPWEWVQWDIKIIESKLFISDCCLSYAPQPYFAEQPVVITHGAQYIWQDLH